MGKLVGEVFNEVEQRTLTVFVECFDGLGIFDFADAVLRHCFRQVAVYATRPEVSRVHTRTRHCLVHVKQRFTLAEAVNQDVHRAAVKTMRTQPQQVVEQAGNLGIHHTDVLGANRYIHAQQFFDGQTVSLLVGHHRHIVEPVHIRKRLDIGFALGQLFSGAVQQADVRISALDHFAIKLQHQA